MTKSYQWHSLVCRWGRDRDFLLDTSADPATQNFLKWTPLYHFETEVVVKSVKQILSFGRQESHSNKRQEEIERERRRDTSNKNTFLFLVFNEETNKCYDDVLWYEERTKLKKIRVSFVFEQWICIFIYLFRLSKERVLYYSLLLTTLMLYLNYQLDSNLLLIS